MQFGPRTLLFVVLLLAMPIAAYLLMFKPLNDAKDVAARDTAQKQEKLTALNKAMVDNKDMAQEIDSLRKAIAYLEGKLPAQKEMDRVLKEVWQLAEKNGLNAKSVRSLKTIEGASYSEAPIKMVIVGSFYPGFYKFLSDVEQLPRLTRINEMKIEADEKNPGVVTVDMVLTIYLRRARKWR